MPKSFRSFLYFQYRYIFRLGFLDGYQGLVWHFLQGFWYRYLVDAKVTEVKRYMKQRDCDVIVAIAKVLDVQV